MMDTAAWKSLSGNQRAIYVEMAARYNGRNNGRISYIVREAAESLHIGKSTAARDLAVLRERGFIIPRIKGAFSLKVRHATEWRLTEFSSDVIPAMATKEFARWSPEIQNTVPSLNSTVPVVEPNDTCSRTAPRKNGAHGTYSGSVNRISANSRYPQRDTSKLPGGCGVDRKSLNSATTDALPKQGSRARLTSVDRQLLNKLEDSEGSDVL
jgi:hypothetical protein